MGNKASSTSSANASAPGIRFKNPFGKPSANSPASTTTTPRIKKITNQNKYDTHFIRTTPTTEPPPRPDVTPKSPAHQELETLRQQLAMTTVRVHVYQQQRETFEREHKPATPWDFSTDQEELEDTPAARLARLRSELMSAKTALVTTKAALHRKKVENGHAAEEEEETKVVVSRDVSGVRGGDGGGVQDVMEHHTTVAAEVGAAVKSENSETTTEDEKVKQTRASTSETSTRRGTTPSSDDTLQSFPGNDFFDSDISSDEGDEGEDGGWL